MEDNRSHPGITMHRLRFGSGVAGLIFTVGSMLIFLIGVPAFWAFLLLAVIGGILIAAVLQRIAPRRPLSVK